MEIKVLEKDKNVVVKEFIFDEHDVKKLEDKAVNSLNKRGYQIEGFRTGKVPKEVYKLRLKDAFYNIYVADEAIKEVEAKLDEEEVKLVLPPVIADAQFDKAGGKVTVELHTEPEVTFEPTKIVVRKAKESEVLDNYVDFMLKNVINEQALEIPKESEASEGDVVKVKETVLLDGKPIRDKQEREYILSKDDERDVIKQLYGRKKGDVIEFEKTFEKSENEKIVYKYILEVEEVYERSLPTLDDEFVKGLQIENVETVDQLKEKFKNDGKQIYDAELEESFKDQIIGQIPNVTQIDVSEKTIRRAVENIIDNLKEEGKYDDYVKRYESEEKLVEELKEYYLKLLKKDIVVKKLAEENDIKVSDDDVREYAQRASVEWGVSPDRAEAIIKSKRELRNEVIMDIVERKVAKSLFDKVQVEEVAVSENNKEQQE
jgi:trigger factor